MKYQFESNRKICHCIECNLVLARPLQDAVCMLTKNRVSISLFDCYSRPNDCPLVEVQDE